MNEAPGTAPRGVANLMATQNAAAATVSKVWGKNDVVPALIMPWMWFLRERRGGRGGEEAKGYGGECEAKENVGGDFAAILPSGGCWYTY